MTGAQAGQMLAVLCEIRAHLREQRSEAGLPPVVLPAQLVDALISPNQAKGVDVAVEPAPQSSEVGQ